VVVPAASGQPVPGRVLGVEREDGVLPGRHDHERVAAASGLPAGDRDVRPGDRVRRRPGPWGEQPAAAAPGEPVEPEEPTESVEEPAEEPRGQGQGQGQGERLTERVLVHPSGFRQSPYADLKPPGEDTRETRRMLAAEERAAREHAERRRREAPRKLWHSSPGSSGH
jgi:error-prone DNA polymerase